MIKKCFSVILSGAMFFAFVACVFALDVSSQQKSAANGTTLDNLMFAYNGEKNANIRYLAFAEKASKEGYDIAASLFRAAAYAEEVHYQRHADIIKKLGATPGFVAESLDVKSTKENLQSSVKGEKYENEVMYPKFLKQAKIENNKDAIDAFEDAGAAEGVHAGLYEKMLSNLTFSRGIIKDFYVCPLCGNIMDAITVARCPICYTETKKFRKKN